MFERFLRFCNDFISVAFDFASKVTDFMTYEINLLNGTYTVFEIMFGGGIAVYLGFMIGKAIIS